MDVHIHTLTQYFRTHARYTNTYTLTVYTCEAQYTHALYTHVRTVYVRTHTHCAYSNCNHTHIHKQECSAESVYYFPSLIKSRGRGEHERRRNVLKREIIMQELCMTARKERVPSRVNTRRRAHFTASENTEKDEGFHSLYGLL